MPCMYFQKIRLAAGESRIVHFTLTADDLAFYRADMSYGAEAGDFELFIGGASDDVRGAHFRLDGGTAR